MVAADRVVPVAIAAAASTACALVIGALHAPGGGAALTVAYAVARGERLPAGDLVHASLHAPAIPEGRLYARVNLQPGVPIVAGDLSTTPPPALASLGSGVVAENVSIAAADLPAGARVGQRVALAGTLAGGSTSDLLANDARVLAESDLSTAAGEPPTVVLTLALPLASALVVADASRAGTLTVLPSRVPVGEAAR